MTDNLSPQYWMTVRVCMSVRRGAFYGHLQTETDIYGLSWGAAVVDWALAVSFTGWCAAPLIFRTAPFLFSTPAVAQKSKLSTK